VIEQIIVIGTGMYSVGRGTDGYGTLLPAIGSFIEESGDAKPIVKFVGSRGKNAPGVVEKIEGYIAVSKRPFPYVVVPSVDEVLPDTYQEVIANAPKSSVVMVAVPDHLHYEVASFAVKFKLPCLVVKPLAPTYCEAKSLADLCDNLRVYGVVEFHKRLDHANLFIKQSLQSKAIGQLLYSVVEYSQRRSIPEVIFRKWARQTNIFQYLGVHYVDLCQYLTGAVPIRVSAVGQRGRLMTNDVTEFDSITCQVEWLKRETHSTFMQLFALNWIDPDSSPAMSNQRIKFVGTHGRIESDQTNRGLAIYSENATYQTPNPYFCQKFTTVTGESTWKGYGIDSVKRFLFDVVKLHRGIHTLRCLSQTRPTFQSCLPTAAVVDACNRSLRANGQWISISEVTEDDSNNLRNDSS